MKKVFIVLIVIAILISAVIYFFPSSKNEVIKENEVVKEVEQKQATEDQVVIHSIRLGDSFNPKPANEDFGAIYSSILLECNVKSANLKLEASVQNGSLNEYDDVFVMIGSGYDELGGHIAFSKENDLANVKVYELGKNDEAQSVNFLPLLNTGKEVRFDIFLSSARPDRKLIAVLEYICQ